MNKYNKQLADYVIANYERIKKQKKSPKNFFVFSNINTKIFAIGNNTKAYHDPLLGNLDILYNQAKNLQAIFHEPISFNTKWIPFIVEMLKVIFIENGDMEYSQLDTNFQSMIVEEDYNNLINYIKQS